MKTNFYNRGQSLIGIIIVLVIVGLISGGVYYYLQKQIPQTPEIVQKTDNEITKPPENSTPSEKIIKEEAPITPPEKVTPQPEPEKPIVQKCTDGTPYNQCSNSNLKYCEEGNLINKCSICGCSSGQKCQANGNCIVSPCVDNDNYCPWECNYWKIDNDCSSPQIYDLIASNDPSGYIGDIIHWGDTEWRNYQPLISQVNNLVSGVNNDYDKAVKIADWVAGSRLYGEPSPANQGKSVVEIFESKSGVCMDAGILTTAMFRIAGFPARAVLPVNAWHEYSEVFIDNRWIGFDSTFNPAGKATVIDPISTITYTNEFLEIKSEVKTHYTDVNYNTSLSDVSFYKVNIIPRTNLTLDWGFVYIPTTNRIIFKNSTSEYSIFYDKDTNTDWGRAYWEIKADNLSCGWYNCNFIDNNDYNCNIQPVGILGYGTWAFRGEFFKSTLSYINNGFFKMALPAGKYKINYGIPYAGDVGYKYFEIKTNENIIILPNSLTKFPEADSKIFDLIIEILNSSIEGLSI